MFCFSTLYRKRPEEGELEKGKRGERRGRLKQNVWHTPPRPNSSATTTYDSFRRQWRAHHTTCLTPNTHGFDACVCEGWMNSPFAACPVVVHCLECFFFFSFCNQCRPTHVPQRARRFDSDHGRALEARH